MPHEAAADAATHAAPVESMLETARASLHEFIAELDDQALATLGAGHYMVLFSFHSLRLFGLDPDRSHTFAAFARVGRSGQIEDTATISWLPVRTEGDGVATTVTREGSWVDIDRIASFLGRPRLGMSYSLVRTLAFGTGRCRLTVHGPYVVDAKVFAAARTWRDRLNLPVRERLAGRRTLPNATPLYVANDMRSFHPWARNATPNAPQGLNCIHAVSFLTGKALFVGPTFGKVATARVRDELVRGRFAETLPMRESQARTACLLLTEAIMAHELAQPQPGHPPG
jgi:hypothetical protein